MAVYTPVSFEQASEHLQQFDLPELVKIQPIKAGVENSNFILHTKVKNYILTLFEKRVTADELPWFIALMQHLHTKKFPSPQPIANQKGEYLTSLNKRPALIVSFLEGKEITMVSAHHCFQVGYMLAKLHQSTRDFPLKRKNTLSNDHWKPIFIKYQDVFEQIAVNSKNEIGDYLEHLLSHWPDHLPYGVCHADLFIDNVFFANDRINGIIDFYFACHDFWAYDLAITLLDWSYKKSPTNVSFNIENACQLIAGYNSLRPLQKDEYRYLKLLCSGAAMRFLLTRAYDWIHTPKDALVKPKNPLEYLHIIRHLHQQKFFIELE